MRAQLQGVLDSLDAREAAVVRMRYGLDGGQPKTLDEIGRAFKLSRERIRQIESETMAKLRHPSRSQVLRDYPENGVSARTGRRMPRSAADPPQSAPGPRRR